MPPNLYETDFYAWALTQAERVRTGQELDRENVAEELEDLGKRQQQQLENRLAILLQHMLKWEHQPERRGPSWEGTIREQRKRANRWLAKNPSLKAVLAETIDEAYATAVTAASVETGIIEDDFPDQCPYDEAEILGEGRP